MKKLATKFAALAAAFVLTASYSANAGPLLDFVKSKKGQTIIAAAVCGQGASEVVKYDNEAYEKAMINVPPRGIVFGVNRPRISDPANNAAVYIVSIDELPSVRPEREEWDALLEKAAPGAFKYFYGQEGHDCAEQEF